MAIEPRRGCGFRKVGGIYLVADGPGMPCGRLPIPLTVCPTCGSGIKQARGWTWVQLPPLVAGIECSVGRNDLTAAEQIEARARCEMHCPLAHPERIGRAGLLWIGERFYPTPDHFTLEAAALGISRRIAAVPRGFKVGQTWVLLAHSKAISVPESVNGGVRHLAGIFRVFCSQRIEKIITDSQSKDPQFMAELRAAGFTPVIVPDSDRDHQGTVYDDEEEPSLPLAEVVH